MPKESTVSFATAEPKWWTSRKKKWSKVEERVKILSFTMTHRLDPRVVNALASQKGVEYFDSHFTNDNPHMGEHWGQYKNMMLNWHKMERIAEGYDKVWLVEDDTIVPEDALAKLLEVDAPVVSGLFASRHAPYAPSLRKRLREPFTWEELKAASGTITVKGTATGCTLLDRSFLDRYHLDMTGYENVTEYQDTQIDYLMNKFCIDNGIEQKARLDVQCGHVKADGKAIWPQDFMN